MSARPCAIVTGASGAIGSAAARALADAGFALLLVGRHAASLQEVVACLPPGTPVDSLCADVADASTAQRAVAGCMQRWGRLDALVNNAAVITPIADLHACSVEAWEEAVRTNLVGPFLLARAAIAAFREGRAGTIVNVTSGAAREPVTQWSAYCASKAGLAMLTRCIDAEYAASAHVRAIDFDPGRVASAMRQAIDQEQPNRVPRGELWPAAWAGRAIAWLCGPGGSDYAGREARLDDALFRTRAGLASGSFSSLSHVLRSHSSKGAST